MRPPVERAPTHGFATIAWDDAALPEGFWNTIQQLPNGCWVDIKEDRDANYRETVVTRLLRVQWKDVLAAVPTCGHWRCCNPAHCCVTMRTVLSSNPPRGVPLASDAHTP